MVALALATSLWAGLAALGGTPFGALLAGALAEVGSVRLALLGTSCFVAVAAAAAWRSSLRDPDTTRYLENES